MDSQKLCIILLKESGDGLYVQGLQYSGLTDIDPVHQRSSMSNTNDKDNHIIIIINIICSSWCLF